MCVCVNKAVEVFDRRLWKRMKRFENVEMINVVIDREFYMKRGQCMNTRGEEKMPIKIACTIKSRLGVNSGMYQAILERIY